MRFRNLIAPLAAVGLAAALAVGQLVPVAKAPPGTPTPVVGAKAPADESGLRKRAEEFAAAFDKGDAKAVVAFFTEDADYVDQVGHAVKGRKQLEKMYAKIFDGQKGSKLAITVTASKLVKPELAIEDGITAVSPADGGVPSVARFSAILVKQDGQWFLESVRDSVAHPPSDHEHLEDLEWLVGDWAAGAEKGESTRASYSWAENQNFLTSTFAVMVNGVPVAGGTQWIAYDHAAKAVRSWSFFSGGGFGEGAWTQDGSKWTVKLTATLPGGKKMTAVNVLTKIDADTATFESSNRAVDGEKLPDIAVVKLKRVK